MKSKKLSSIACLIAAATLALLPAHAAKTQPTPAATSLNDVGNALATHYGMILHSLIEEMGKEMDTKFPKIDDSLKADFTKAVEAELAAAGDVKKAHAAASGKKTTDKAAAEKALADAQQTLTTAQAKAQETANSLLTQLAPFLASDKLDVPLAKAMLIARATPAGLAAFAQNGKDHQALVEKLLADESLMKQMLVAGGASHGKYGEAMQILTAIQKASPKAGEGHFQRLALATALEHAVPIAQNNAPEQTNAAATIDPVKRYLHYEEACLAGELDPAFPKLTVWEMRMVVNGDASDEIMTWGREMLRNYRPDHLLTENPGWRYSLLVKTDVLYGSKDVANDLPSLQQYQNILKNGGVCGRRAFFARFLLRSFGIPVWGVTQKAHAAVGRWTPDGWVVNLGAAFKWSWWDRDEAPPEWN